MMTSDKRKSLRCLLIVLLLLLTLGSAVAEADQQAVLLLPSEIGEFFLPDANEQGQAVHRPNGTHYGYTDDYWGGCSHWCSVTSFERSVETSSTLPPQGAYSYEADHLIDGLRKTAWVEGVDGYGIGESITIRQKGVISDGEYPLQYTGVCIVTGYARTEKAWKNNTRVEKLALYMNDRYLCTLLLQDVRKPQYFDLSGMNLSVDSGVETVFRLVIEDVYPGAKYEDTALTGIVFEFANANH